MNGFYSGLILGFSIAAPVGPIGLLCIKRTLSEGRLAGFLSGLGAATADAFYGSVAAFGLATVSGFLVNQQMILRLVGGLFLIYLGVRTFLSSPTIQSAESQRKSLVAAYFSTFILTLTNPLTILSFAAVFAGLGLGSRQNNYFQAAQLVLGVFGGSTFWWFLLSFVTGIFQNRLVGPGLVWVNRFSGALIIIFGIVALFGLIGRDQGLKATITTESPVSDQDMSTGYSRAESVVRFNFPRDHGAHTDYQTEWWYYTGNLTSTGGERIGFQLTFFRRALIPPALRIERSSSWGTDQVYMAHFALTDGDRKRHYSYEQLARGSAEIAGAQGEPFSVWLKNWQVSLVNSKTYKLSADVSAQGDMPDLALDLTMTDTKGPILQGNQGYSQKGPEAGDASYYYSITRLILTGNVVIDGKPYTVDGLGWMDHEYSTSALANNQIGWDWFSIQLDNNFELMVFQIRRSDGSLDPFSSGTLIAPDGSTTQLTREDFTIVVLDTWHSRQSNATYPARWSLKVPEQEIDIQIKPILADQELYLRYTYWEGAVDIQGTFRDVNINGVGYVELTGYAGSMGGEF